MSSPPLYPPPPSSPPLPDAYRDDQRYEYKPPPPAPSDAVPGYPLLNGNPNQSQRYQPVLPPPSAYYYATNPPVTQQLPPVSSGGGGGGGGGSGGGGTWHFQDPNRHPSHGGPDFGYCAAFAEVEVRRVFVRRVFSLVTAMMCCAFVASLVFMFVPEVKAWVAVNPWTLWVAFIGFFGLMLAVGDHQGNKGRGEPLFFFVFPFVSGCFGF